jgi:hypothetical protein
VKDKRNATPETCTKSKIPDVPETMGNDLKSLKKKERKKELTFNFQLIEIKQL